MHRRLRWALAGIALLALGLGCGGEQAPDERVEPEEGPGGERAQDRQRYRWGAGPICIDPGHGGRDSGTVGGDGAVEKEITLDIARRVRQGLEAAGAAVVMTRTDDGFVALGRRAAICNEAHAGLFVSIHVNGYHTPDVYGFEVYYLGDGSLPEAGRAAEAIRRALYETLDTRDRGVRQADFSVLSAANCPAVLVEVGYLSNPDERDHLMLGAYRQAIADATVAGILAFGTDTTGTLHEEQP